MLDQNNRPKPWKILKSKTTFEDKWLRLRSDRCETANGDIVEPYHVIKFPEWINIIAFDQESLELILVDEYRHGAGHAVFGLVSGAVDDVDGRSISVASKAAAKRELLEETGYRTHDPKLLLTAMPNPATQSNLVRSYISFDAQRVAEPNFDAGGSEFCLTVKRDFVDVLADISSGELIMQAMHVAALWSAARYILKTADLPDNVHPLRDKVCTFLFD